MSAITRTDIDKSELVTHGLLLCCQTARAREPRSVKTKRLTTAKKLNKIGYKTTAQVHVPTIRNEHSVLRCSYLIKRARVSAVVNDATKILNLARA